MDTSTQTPHPFLALEDFYLHHQNTTTGFLGWRGAQAAWALKDMDPSSEETESVCRRLQKSIRELVGSRPAQWVIDVEESHTQLDLESWVEDSLKLAIDSRPESCGYPDLDLNIETQLNCGTQLEEFHRADWAKNRLSAMFDCKNFEALEPLVCRFEHPLPDLLAKLDKDLSIGVRGGMRHPYSCSVAIGALSLRLLPHEGKPEETIALTRRVKVSEVGEVVRRLKEEINERRNGLTGAIKEQQENLRCLPTNWPSEAVYQAMQEWSAKRFVGDNGLMGSDLFEGDWLMSSMPSDSVRETRLMVSEDASAAQSLAQLRHLEQGSQAAAEELEGAAPANFKERLKARGAQKAAAQTKLSKAASPSI